MQHKHYILILMFACHATDAQANWLTWCLKKPFSVLCYLIKSVTPCIPSSRSFVTKKVDMKVQSLTGNVEELTSARKKKIEETMKITGRNQEQLSLVSRQLEFLKEQGSALDTEMDQKFSEVRAQIEQARSLHKKFHEERCRQLHQLCLEIANIKMNVENEMKKVNETTMYVQTGINLSKVITRELQVSSSFQPDINEVENNGLRLLGFAQIFQHVRSNEQENKETLNIGQFPINDDLFKNSPVGRLQLCPKQ